MLTYDSFEAALKLELYNILDVNSEVISEVAAAVESAELPGVQIDWLSGIIREIHSEQRHYELIQMPIH